MGKTKKTANGKQEKKTPVKLRPIQRTDAGKITEPWVILERLLEKCPCFKPIREVNIRMYWTRDWKPDVDGVVTGAMCAKASEKDRLAAEEAKKAVPDADVILPQTVWPTLDDTEKEQRIFHELCHIAFSKDSKGEVKRTTKDWPVVRIRRHPIVAFPEEVERFGAERVLGRYRSMAEAVEHAEMPLLRNSGSNGHPAKPWRQRDVDSLRDVDPKISEAKIKNLHEAKLDTLGELADKMDRESTWWYKGSGIGAEYAQRIADALGKVRVKEDAPEVTTA